MRIPPNVESLPSRVVSPQRSKRGYKFKSPSIIMMISIQDNKRFIKFKKKERKKKLSHTEFFEKKNSLIFTNLSVYLKKSSFEIIISFMKRNLMLN